MMKIINKYVHGSADSLDKDVYYQVDELGTFQECKAFCDAIKDENANLIVIENGIVTKVYKGTPDEVNNSLRSTFSLHKENLDIENPIKDRLKRDKPLKYIRAVRIILSHLSRSQYRELIKATLLKGWSVRLNILQEIDLSAIDFTTLNKSMSDKDIKKVIAFQIGQALGLLDGVELYTKAEIAEHYPLLMPFLYRIEAETYILDGMKNYLIKRLREIPVIAENDSDPTVAFLEGLYDIRNEKHLIWNK